MNKIAAIKKLNEAELDLGIAGTAASWHQKYLQCDTIYIGGLPNNFTEQDVLAVLEQYGTILHVHLIRDSNTNASRGFAFAKYADPRSCILAVDNLNGFEINGRALRLDHADDYRDKDRAGTDTTPSGFHMPNEKKSDHLAEIEQAEDIVVQLSAEKRRENAVLNRLEQLRKRRKLNIDDQNTNAAENSPSAFEPNEPSNVESTVVGRPRQNSAEKKQKREEKERRRREKEKRKEDRARIRKERIERRAARQNAT